jgi:branched-chain amino acid transport system ATP-binding protein
MIKLEINNLHKSFASTFTGASGKAEIETSEVLRGVNIFLKPATVTALIGSNGSGKSTLFNLISGLTKPDKGEIHYQYDGNQYNLLKIPSHRLASIGIARLFQGNNIFPGLSVIENMMVADNVLLGEQPWHIIFKYKKTKRAEKYRVEEAENILANLLGFNNPLWQNKNIPAGTLSLGQQRLLAFARLLMNERAELFLLDEPCAGVNSLIREKIAEIICLLQSQNKSILIIEHNLDFAQLTATEALFLENGKIALNCNVNEMLENNYFRKSYFGEDKNEN